MDRSALVTGAKGFVGTILSKYLTDRGWSVKRSDIHEEESESYLQCDFTKDSEVREMVEWARNVSHVFHLAAITFVPEANRHPAAVYRVNVMGTVYLAQALRKQIPDARFLYVSTSEVYGKPQSIPIRETHPLGAGHPYAISKAAADRHCLYLHGSYGADAVVARPFNHSGPGQPAGFVLPNFARQIAAIEAGMKPPVIQVGNLDAARDFLHVGDVVRSYEMLALQGEAGEAYNVCSGSSWTIRAALDALLELSSMDIAVKVDPDRLRPVDEREILGSHDKLTSKTGWRPERRLQDMLGELLEYWRAEVAKEAVEK